MGKHVQIVHLLRWEYLRWWRESVGCKFRTRFHKKLRVPRAITFWRQSQMITYSSSRASKESSSDHRESKRRTLHQRTINSSFLIQEMSSAFLHKATGVWLTMKSVTKVTKAKTHDWRTFNLPQQIANVATSSLEITKPTSRQLTHHIAKLKKVHLEENRLIWSKCLKSTLTHKLNSSFQVTSNIMSDMYKPSLTEWHIEIQV